MHYNNLRNRGENLGSGRTLAVVGRQPPLDDLALGVDQNAAGPRQLRPGGKGSGSSMPKAETAAPSGSESICTPGASSCWSSANSSRGAMPSAKTRAPLAAKPSYSSASWTSSRTQ